MEMALINGKHEDINQNYRTGKDYASCTKKRRCVLPMEQVHPNLRHVHITGEYLPQDQSWWFYCKSVVTILNHETFNVWSHLIPALVFACLLYRTTQREELEGCSAYPSLVVHGIGMVICASFSSIAHTFNPKSRLVNTAVFQMDYTGIAIGIYGVGVSNFSIVADDALREVISQWYLLLLFLATVAMMILCGLSRLCFPLINLPSLARRMLQIWPIVVLTIIANIPAIIEFYVEMTKKPTFGFLMASYLTAIFFWGLATYFFVTRIPERWAPGKWNLIHSHGIFHVFTGIGTGLYYWTAEQDLLSQRAKCTSLSEAVDLVSSGVPQGDIPGPHVMYGSMIMLLVLGAAWVLLTHDARLHRLRTDDQLSKIKCR